MSLEHDIHAALKQPSLFDKIRDRAGTEADEFATKGKGYVSDKVIKALPPDTLPKLGHALTQMFERMNKQAGVLGNAVRTVARAPAAVAGMAPAKKTALNEIGGLGVLAVPGLDTLQSKVRARMAGDRTEEGASKRRLLGEGAHAALDVGGLGMLAAPEFGHFKHAFSPSAYGGNTAQNPPGMRGRSQVPPFTAPELEVKKASMLNVKDLAKDPMRKAEGLKRVGEKLLATRAKRLVDMHKGLGQDIGTLKGTIAAGTKGHGLHGDIPFGKNNKLPAQDRALEALERKQGVVGSELKKEHFDVSNTRGKAKALGTGAAVYGGVPAGMYALTRHNKKKAQERKAEKSAKNKPKVAGVGVGAGMSTSQYSGRLSDGKFKLTSPAPGFTQPELASKQAAAFVATTIDLLKSAAGMNTATDAMHAAGRLHATQSVGAPKTTAPPGPSIAQVAKPKGYGTPISGAKKNSL